MSGLSGVRIEPDGTRENIVGQTFPGSLSDWLRGEFDGWHEFAHYGTNDLAVCVAVHEDSMARDLPNRLATALVEKLRGGPLGYCLHGVVFVFGYLPRTDVITDLQDDTRAILHGLTHVDVTTGGGQ